MPSLRRILSVTAILALAITSPAEAQRMKPFSIRQIASDTPATRNGFAEYVKLLKKYNADPAHIEAVQAAAGSVPAYPAPDDEEYYCPVTIGDQTFHLDFDTGSSDLWVLGEKLRQPESNHTFYSPSKTATLLNGSTWAIQYVDRSTASGIVYNDTVTIGGVSVPKQAVEVATNASSYFTDNSTPSDGLLGLGYDFINEANPQVKTWFSNAVDAGLPAMFTANLKHKAPGTYTFGEINPAEHKGDITYTHAGNGIGVDAFGPKGYGIGGEITMLNDTSSLAGVVDTGSSVILIDNDITAAYYAKVEGAVDHGSGYTYPCNSTLPDFTLIIEGYHAVIPAVNANYSNLGNGSCFGGIQSRGTLFFNIFGDPLIKSQFVVWDRRNLTAPRLGFAPQA